MRRMVKIATGVAALSLVAGMAACSSDPKPQGKFSQLTGNDTTVVFEPAFLTAITGLGVKPAPFGAAKIRTSGGKTMASFPITGGNATIYKKGDKTPYVQGQIDHSGSGLKLTAGSTTVTMKNFVVHPGDNSNLTGEVDVNGQQAYKSVKLFDLDGSTLQTPTISGGVATLQGTTIYLSPEAAGALNKTFKLSGSKALPTASEKIDVGTAIIKATGTA